MNLKIALIQEKQGNTGAFYINKLITTKLRKAGHKVKNFYPEKDNFILPPSLRGLRNILFFYSLKEKKKQIYKYDLIQGTTFTPLAFVNSEIPVISHFGSTTKGFLELTPKIVLEKKLKKIWDNLLKDKVIDQLDYQSRRPLEDIAEIENYVALNANEIIASSRIVKNDLLSIGVKEGKIKVIHNAIEDFWYKNKKQKFLEKLQIVFLGRIGNDAFNFKLKGMDRMIDLFQNFPQLKKNILCETGNKALPLWLKTNIDNILVSVNTPKEKIPTILGGLKGAVMFLPSRYEGFSLSLIEGMSQGLIPVAYGVGVVPEIIRNGKNGFIVSSQEEAIKIIRLLESNSILRERCSKEAQKTSLMFTGEKMIKKLVVLYEKHKLM